MDRSEFIKKSLILTTVGGVALNLVSCKDDSVNLELKNPIDIDLNSTPFDDLLVPGNWLLHPDENVLLVNVAGEIRAFSSVCPHQQCTRSWNYSPGVFTCTCHVSQFDSTGQFLKGPANENLKEFSVSQVDNTITVG